MKTTAVWMLCMVVITTNALPARNRQQPDQIGKRSESQEKSGVRTIERGDGRPVPPISDRDLIERSDEQHADSKPVPQEWRQRNPPVLDRGFVRENDGEQPDLKPEVEARQPPNPPDLDRGPIRESDGQERNGDLKSVARAWQNRRRPDSSPGEDKLPTRDYMQRMLSNIRDRIPQPLHKPGQEGRRTLTQPEIRSMLPDFDSSKNSRTEGEARVEPEDHGGERTKSQEGVKQPEAFGHLERMISRIRDSVHDRFIKPNVGSNGRTKSGEGEKQTEATEAMQRMLSRIRDSVQQRIMKTEVRDGARTKFMEWAKRTASSQPRRFNQDAHDHARYPTNADDEITKSREGANRPESLEPIQKKVYSVRDSIHKRIVEPVRDGEKTKSLEGTKRTEVRSMPMQDRLTSPERSSSKTAKSIEGAIRPELSKLRPRSREAHGHVRHPNPEIRDGENTKSGDGHKRTEVRSAPMPVRLALPEYARSERTKSGEKVKPPESPKRLNPVPDYPMHPTNGDDMKTKSGEEAKRREERLEPKPRSFATSQHAISERTKAGEDNKQPESSERRRIRPEAHVHVWHPIPEVHDGNRTKSGQGAKRTEERSDRFAERSASVHSNPNLRHYRGENKPQEKVSGWSEDRELGMMSNNRRGRDSFSSGQSRRPSREKSN